MAEETRYRLTPTGLFALEVMEAMDKMLLEQRRELSRQLMLAAAAVESGNSFDFGTHLADSVCICGLIPMEQDRLDV